MALAHAVPGVAENLYRRDEAVPRLFVARMTICSTASLDITSSPFFYKLAQNFQKLMYMKRQLLSLQWKAREAVRTVPLPGSGLMQQKAEGVLENRFRGLYRGA